MQHAITTLSAAISLVWVAFRLCYGSLPVSASTSQLGPARTACLHPPARACGHCRVLKSSDFPREGLQAANPCLQVHPIPRATPVSWGGVRQHTQSRGAQCALVRTSLPPCKRHRRSSIPSIQMHLSTIPGACYAQTEPCARHVSPPLPCFALCLQGVLPRTGAAL